MYVMVWNLFYVWSVTPASQLFYTAYCVMCFLLHQSNLIPPNSHHDFTLNHVIPSHSLPRTALCRVPNQLLQCIFLLLIGWIKSQRSYRNIRIKCARCHSFQSVLLNKTVSVREVMWKRCSLPFYSVTTLPVCSSWEMWGLFPVRCRVTCAVVTCPGT
jgi:hypothetical protein